MKDNFFMKPNLNECHPNYNTQIQLQGITIRQSSFVFVTQVEVQALIVLQIALKATLSALLLTEESCDEDVRAINHIMQQINTVQKQRQRVLIENSQNVILNQDEINIEVIVLAATDLLANLTAKIAA